ncbi:FKBP-type peptidyl-prolyl cis-trans isomerase [Algoriphagus confluentis]|uniref:Peptidyl-prolyl cis-trans isomerase n=1 Tax=Algoriphagus confluentis TaxID=1697556 RepID=A0ABQ6PU56_9BACT|nr:hypothetical protein Aconfl_41250 [Algoriphagus confluentis]
MNPRLKALFTVLIGSFAALSCVDPDQTQEVLLERDKEAIEKYLLENPLPSAKEYTDQFSGFYLFWEVSVDPTYNETILVADTVRFNYTGKLLSNSVFGTSIEQVARDNNIYRESDTYEPIQIVMNDPRFGAIPGVEFALALMRPGEKATVIFPSRLGYGSESRPGIPPNSPLVFDLELVQVKEGLNHLNP